ncbi:MAG: Piwi domain-containing protein [Desulfurococcus sp.]|uniref:Piwi domain-containing protein n=1 Tax=Desulfurococcus sp. TaxID=51678 RepID=UPI00315EB3AD
MRLYRVFKPTEFKLKFANGTSINAYSIVNLEPLSRSPIYRGSIEGVDKYELILILHHQDKIKLAEKLQEDMRNGLRENKKIFPGFNQALKTDIEIETASFNDYDPDEIYDVYSKYGSPDKVFPLIVIPKVSKSEYDNIYYRTKARFLASDVPSQIVTEDLIRDNDRYRWSLLSISIQIFAKMGGIPYALDRSVIRLEDPSSTSIAIMGLGISAHPLHRRRGVGYITLFDHNGVWNFMDSKVLSMDRQEDMSRRIAGLLEESIKKLLSISSKKNNILVIHYSGKEIGRREEEAIKRAIRNTESMNKFAAVYVLKIRDSDIIFGLQNGPHTSKDGIPTDYPPVGAVIQLKPDVYAMATTGYFDLGEGTGRSMIRANIRKGLPTIKIISRHRDAEISNLGSNISDNDLLSTVFGMCRLNYVAISNPVSREPVTIRYSREIAWITLRLIESRVDVSRLSRVKYVMWFL